MIGLLCASNEVVEIVVVSVAYPGKVVGINCSLTAVELIVATSTIPAVGNRTLDPADGIPGGGPDGVPAEDPRLNERFDDNVDGGGTFGTPDDGMKDAEGTPDEPPADCPRT